MNFALLLASVLLAVAASWSLVFLQRLRDWRAAIVIAWFAGMVVLLVMTVRGQFVPAEQAHALGPGPLRQTAISGLAIAAALFFHYIFQHDTLTGLPSRPLFLKRLAIGLRRVRRGGAGQLAVLSVDLDRFKMINDGLGNDRADEFVLVAAKRLQGCVRPGDVVARLGGDQFAFLLADVGETEAHLAAERVHRVLKRPIVLKGQEVSTTATIGIALAGSSSPSKPDTLLRQADLAKSRAQEEASRHAVYDESMQHVAIERLRLEAGLRRALEQEELRLYYQPIVSLRDRRVVAFEALLRWHDPTRGIVMPDEFLPVAEDTGLIVPIGTWTLKEACRQIGEWMTQFGGASDVVVHVNVSGKQFAEADLAEQVRRILTRTNVPPGSLGLEITESVVMADADRATGMLRKLRSLGVKLQVDDFGTGYSSLSYLSRFPIDTLKIDRSFVIGMRKNSDNAKIVRSIISLAKDLELGVIAEGVERASHLRNLTDFGCRLGQGRHLGSPMEAEAASRLIADGVASAPSRAKAG
jgi:diguanylate cyclase (GGDEF)-like protein